MKATLLLALGAVFILAGCANRPVQTYAWGNYEGSLYGLMKDPTSLDKYGRALQKQIQDGEVSGKVPPGIYAEYGYFLSVTNQPGEAVKYFGKEKQRWPESARLMDKMILNCQAPKPPSPAPQTAPPPMPPPAAAAAPAPAPTATPTPAPTVTPVPAKAS